MFKINLSKAMLSVGFIGAVFFAYETLGKNSVEDLGSNKKLFQSGLIEDWNSGNVIFLIRHEERCDRSSNPCLGLHDGITRFGSEKAKEAGSRIKSYFGLDNTDIFTTPTTRTIQTSEFMLGKASLLPDRETICGNDIIDKLLKHKAPSKNLILITHNTCIKDLIKATDYKKPGNPQYGSLLFAKFSSHNTMQIIGTLDTGDLPK
ncbi:histidine phosphatase family protein [Pseudomonas marginalis]|nr:histidine phosphatase family protein [Pseudomonas marginalis]